MDRGEEEDKPGPSRQEGITLRRSLGIPGAASMVAGGMIGSGIFVSARWVLVYSGSVGMTMAVWLVCGMLVFIGGMCWVELGLTFPKCGGEYTLIKETLGDLPAFAIIWLKILISTPANSCLLSLTFATYTTEVFFPGCSERQDLTPLKKIIAASAIGLLSFINIFSSRHAVRVQIVFTVGKFLALIMIIMTGFVRLAQGHTLNFRSPFQGTTSQIGMIGVACQAALWAYDGWDGLNDISEEITRPKRNMPWAVLGSIFTVMGVYILTNISYLTVLPCSRLFSTRMYGPVAWIIPVCVACSVFGSMNGSCFMSGRTTFAAAREGHLPSFLAMIHPTKRTPIPSLLFQVYHTDGKTIQSCLMLIPARSTIQNLISVIGFAAWFVYTLTTIGLLRARYRQPRLPRPFKLPLVIPILFLVICLYLTITPIKEAPIESALSFVGLIVGIPVYFILIRYRLTPRCIVRLLDYLTYKIQEVFNVVYPKAADEITFDE